MEVRDNKLRMLSKLIEIKNMGDVTSYGYINPEVTDSFLEEIISEFKEALSVYHKSLDELADKLIHHLGQ